jgi:hypothetical protein
VRSDFGTLERQVARSPVNIAYSRCSMFGLIVLAILGVIVWKLWMPALSFAQGFRLLLERPTG